MPNLTLLNTMPRFVLPSLPTLSATLASFTRPSHSKPDLAQPMSRSVLPNLPTLSFTLAGFTRPSRTKPDLARYRISRCLA